MSLTLSEAELVELTGYRRPADQIRELHRRGFSRAYVNRLGRVVLERAHYMAVCGMHVERPRPKVKVRAAA
ncbi:MAG TPA: DUF4224 domain-containing protein [Burkholderiaceae bacterium]|nr:DUF4224 domain-containing protein [Burkholderiaceae bacterium]